MLELEHVFRKRHAVFQEQFAIVSHVKVRVNLLCVWLIFCQDSQIIFSVAPFQAVRPAVLLNVCCRLLRWLSLLPKRRAFLLDCDTVLLSVSTQSKLQSSKSYLLQDFHYPLLPQREL